MPKTIGDQGDADHPHPDRVDAEVAAGEEVEVCGANHEQRPGDAVWAIPAAFHARDASRPHPTARTDQSSWASSHGDAAHPRGLDCPACPPVPCPSSCPRTTRRSGSGPRSTSCSATCTGAGRGPRGPARAERAPGDDPGPRRGRRQHRRHRRPRPRPARGGGRRARAADRPARRQGRRGPAGMVAADGEIVIFTDADMATPPDEIPLLVEALETADAAYGSRIQPDGSDMRASQPAWRRALGKTFHALASLWVVGPVQDTQCGFKGFRRDVARDVFARQKVTSIVFDVEVIFLVRRRGYTLGRRPDPLGRSTRLAHAPGPAARDPAWRGTCSGSRCSTGTSSGSSAGRAISPRPEPRLVDAPDRGAGAPPRPDRDRRLRPRPGPRRSHPPDRRSATTSSPTTRPPPACSTARPPTTRRSRAPAASASSTTRPPSSR